MTLIEVNSITIRGIDNEGLKYSINGGKPVKVIFAEKNYKQISKGRLENGVFISEKEIKRRNRERFLAHWKPLYEDALKSATEVFLWETDKGNRDYTGYRGVGRTDWEKKSIVSPKGETIKIIYEYDAGWTAGEGRCAWTGAYLDGHNGPGVITQEKEYIKPKLEVHVTACTSFGGGEYDEIEFHGLKKSLVFYSRTDAAVVWPVLSR